MATCLGSQTAPCLVAASSSGLKSQAGYRHATSVHCPVVHGHWQGAALRRNFGVQLRETQRQRRQHSPAQALLGEGDSAEGDVQVTKRKGLKREDEPKQYWQTAAEKEGKGPMETLLPYIAILGLLTPFIILGIAFASGYIKGPGY